MSMTLRRITRIAEVSEARLSRSRSKTRPAEANKASQRAELRAGARYFTPGVRQFPAGDCSHRIALRQGAGPPLFIGVFNHAIKPCRATGNWLGSLSDGIGWPAEGTSDGVSQYGLPLANDRSAAVFDELRSGTAPVSESFSSAPTCSWDALSVRRTFRANQIPTARKTNSAKRFPSSYQLLCIHAVNSFIASPSTGTPSTYNSAPAGETGRKSSKWAGSYTALAAQPPARAASVRSVSENFAF